MAPVAKKRSRKLANPTRAPSNTTKRQHPHTTECINVSLLLRALLRSATVDATYDNLRAQSSSGISTPLQTPTTTHGTTTSPRHRSPTKPTRQQTRTNNDDLPIGKIHRTNPKLEPTQTTQRSTSVEPLTQHHNHRQKLKSSSTVTTTEPHRRRRAQSQDRLTTTSSGVTTTTKMTRASSLGPHHHHHSSPTTTHVSAFQPSPLSSFVTDHDLNPPSSSSSSSSSPSSSQTLNDHHVAMTRTRHVELPKHMQDFEMTTT
ncbi:hypothetical protein OIO90_001859 [Microbotryomycetes sp. JL221]|nr:hypothetical protein OIO90_001859 [Microbotryomycetes sp. JL221]